MLHLQEAAYERRRKLDFLGMRFNFEHLEHKASKPCRVLVLLELTGKLFAPGAGVPWRPAGTAVLAAAGCVLAS